ncbi:hypothetical protein C9374_013084 [Naegleria lovaniensis]|uniref:RGS domain-containing protein n=1 Tax=Naegleria lovaniensis TaxID=51637 RepID=A0AA88KHH9_NAELO|nr:uncharacterized protein C9374_013084 [Naegleria lovaniensis]KAG2372877.1 hypothetical protein C9374_013084 [Naegleria lovaniensis]
MATLTPSLPLSPITMLLFSSILLLQSFLLAHALSCPEQLSSLHHIFHESNIPLDKVENYMTLILNDSSGPSFSFDTHVNITSLSSDVESLIQKRGISFIASYLTAFVWRDVSNQFNIFTTQDLLQYLKKSSSSNEFNQLSPLMIGVEETVYPIFKKALEFFNLNLNALHVKQHIVTMYLCKPSQMFLESDILITSSSQFYRTINYYKTPLGNRKPTKTYISKSETQIDPWDFVPIRLVPLRIAFPGFKYHPLFSFGISNPFPFDNKYFVLNEIALARYFHFGNVSKEDLQFIQYLIPNINTENVVHDASFEIMMQNTRERFNISLYENNLAQYNLTTLTSILLPSLNLKQYDARIALFLGPDEFIFFGTDYWFVAVAFIYLVYFLFLFSMRAFRLPSIKRRLVIPYLPLLFILFELTQLFLWIPCQLIPKYLGEILVVFCICAYSCCILRFLYLRNLYRLISLRFNQTTQKKKRSSTMRREQQDEKHRWWPNVRKTLLFPMTGFVMSFCIIGVVSLVLSVVLTIHCLVSYFYVNYSMFVVMINVTFSVFILIATFLGVFIVALDAIRNRSILREKGIRRFLFFDDPLMVRIDLIFLSLIFILVIIVIIVNSVGGFNSNIIYMLRFLLHCIVMLISGGNVLVIELFTKCRRFVRNRWNNSSSQGNEPSQEPLQSELETLLLTNREFKELFEEYATKEMSLENLLCFQKIHLVLEKKGPNHVLSVEWMKQLDHDFIKSTGTYELNLSSETKKAFYQLMDRVVTLSQQENSTEPQTQNIALENVVHVPNGDTRVELGHENLRESDVFSMPTITDLKNVLMQDVMTNLTDTRYRLMETREYEEWWKVYRIQKASAIL